ncbi:MAG TPA: PEP-CTERM sorting domain-containing protein [Gemmatimonadaceae bacterium]|nr:PEP-CTERM sorting domain-containing protein [Gemmatimonadaceae bacterium]
MKALRTLAAGIALVALASPAVAQTHTLKLTDVGSGTTMSTSHGTVYISPYGGVIDGPGTPRVDIYCVDYAHFATLNNTWDVNIARVGAGALGTTRGGEAALAQYQQSAWLSMQFGPNATQQKAIQSAIWQVMGFSDGPVVTGGAAGLDAADTQYWVDLAQSRYLTDFSAAFYYYNFAVLTPTNPQDPRSAQEFLTRDIIPTPEPSTYLMLGSGLLALVGVTRSRRRRLLG